MFCYDHWHAAFHIKQFNVKKENNETQIYANMQLNIPCFNKLKLKFTYRAVKLLESKKRIKNPNISQFMQCEIDPAAKPR